MGLVDHSDVPDPGVTPVITGQAGACRIDRCLSVRLKRGGDMHRIRRIGKCASVDRPRDVQGEQRQNQQMGDEANHTTRYPVPNLSALQAVCGRRCSCVRDGVIVKHASIKTTGCAKRSQCNDLVTVARKRPVSVTPCAANRTAWNVSRCRCMVDGLLSDASCADRWRSLRTRSSRGPTLRRAARTAR